MKTLISTLFFIMVNVSFADEMRYYDVEIVVIENLDEGQRASEKWPLQVNLTLPEKIITLGQPFDKEWLPKEADSKESYKVLNSSHYQLGSEIEKIDESKKQRVIFHTAWRQPGLDKNLSLPVYFKREVPAPPVLEDENQAETNLENEPTSENITTPSILEGILRVTLARYLHLEAELVFQNKIPELPKSDNPFEALDNESMRKALQKQGVIHFKQKRRRIRSNELHYLDHPVLSILVRMTPYEKPENTGLRK
ncbi:MAG TPA: hypothetical protein ENJ28_12090 [Gammaproteobacteria bacterium]|nr:hypothetical protein [Gammaproteobacteria bacterium]